MRKSGKSVNVGGKPFSKVLGVGLPLLLVSMLGLWAGASRSAAVAPSETSRSPQAAPAVAGLTQPQGVSPSPSAGTRAWIPGVLYRYALNAEQKISFRPAQPGAQVLPGMRFILRGEWTVGVVSAEAERVDARVSLQLSSLTVEVGDNGPVAPDVQQNLATALQVPFFLTHDKSGRVTLTHFEQVADPLVRGILRSIVASSQFVVVGAPGATWKAEEFDTTGRYSAGYQRLEPSRFEKRKLSYSHVAFPQGLEPLGGQVRIDVSARSTFALAQDLWTSSLDAQERVEVEAGQTMPPTTYESSLSLSLLERRVDPTLIGAFVARRAWLSSAAMSAFQGMEQDPMDQYRQVLGGKDFDTLVKELRALPGEPTARDEVRSISLERLRALFMLHPSEAAKVPDIIRAGMDPLAASPMLGALSAASTREAIQALAEVTGDRSIPHDIRMDSVAALGVAKDPTAEGLEALRGVAGEEDGMLRDTARLALGNAAAQLTDTDPKGAEDLVGELTRDYRSASTAEARAGALNSLGNTRSPSALATLEDALGSQDPRVRQAALNALRIIQDPRADQLLARHLLKDPAPEVRQAAVFASNFRPLAPLLPALAQALRMDPADGVRNEVIHLLGDQRALVPEALPLLAWASQHDANPDLRRAAAVFVNTPTTSNSTPLASP
ncbi:HEAT repeat domain-containing protein [Myxococcus qinghaiensis]|uniref:HEAT repeat domain-containing protein n=1 Tax=Myxococcus qinghaiensis TaxID=2906758 RepID=UPI0020A80796|nr:HEAT repeat domain-containing protein [Myxococcus qinghaiensis]MCP3163759.1 HEAT repeat domain-containing protein [Myxococcus qinghaiensis]